MRIALVCAGSRGDVQPYVALAEGMKQAGYHVRLVTHEPFASWAEVRGLEFAPLRGNPRDLMTRIWHRRALAAGRNPLVFMRTMMKAFREFMPAFLEDTLKGCQGVQGIVFSTLGFPAYHIAEAMGVPAVAAFLQPQTRTSAFPAPIGAVPRWLHRFGWFNRWTYVAMELSVWNLIRKDINRWRRETLGLPPLSALGPYPRLYRGEIPVLYGFSRYVVPRPADWGDHIHITGYWFLNTEALEPPSPELEAFLREKEPVVAIGFGSMPLPHPERMARAITEALERTGLRAVVLSGWGRLPLRPSRRIFVTEQVAHEWLFPRVDAVVHHAGGGTTATGLKHGRPTVPVPFFVDQFFWAYRVHALGVGSTPVPAHGLTARRLAQALEQVTHDPTLRERAAHLGERLRREDGVARAVSLLERYLK